MDVHAVSIMGKKKEIILPEVTISRKEAASKNMIYFFSGEPCKNGHVSLRYTKNNLCLLCARSEETKKKSKLYYANNSQKIIEKVRQYSIDNPFYERSNRLKRRYGITLEEFNSMFIRQGKRCLLCGTDSPDGRNWAVDHSHKTGEVRGILCTKCNVMIAMARDSVDMLRRGISYLSVNAMEATSNSLLSFGA
jgi:hypothetical protein